MSTICKACNLSGHGMILIYAHPNNIDGVFTSITGIKIIENEYLCIPCYDDMKIAFSFRQKCLRSELIRQVALETKLEPTFQLSEPTDPPNDASDDIQVNVEVIDEPDKGNLKEQEISTTSVTECIVFKSESSSEPVNFPVESTTDYAIEIDNADRLDVPDEVVDYENDDADVSDALMIDFQEVDKSDYHDDDLNEESDDSYQISPSFIWKCRECNKSFARKGNFQKHAKIHLKSLDGKRKVTIRKKRVQTPKYSEEDIFQGISENQCEFCFKEFEGPKERQLHEVDHRIEEKPYKCPFDNCASHFKEKYGLRNHIKIHSDYKRYKCRYCDHRFHQRGNIISHERLHTGEKPFLCPHCGKAFAESGNLKAHIRFHTGERPYICSVCSKSFKTHYAHKIHFRTHTKERPYLCSECGKSFSSSGKLLVHKRIHTGQRPYKCGECPSAFVNSTGLKRHSKIHISRRMIK